MGLRSGAAVFSGRIAARDDRLALPACQGASPSSIKRSAHRARPVDKLDGSADYACTFVVLHAVSEGVFRWVTSGINGPPYWWQTVTASRAFRTQPNEGGIEGGSSWTPPAAPSGTNSGILGQLARPANESSGHSPPKSLGLLGQLLTGAGMAQATSNGLTTGTSADVGNYITPAASRPSNMAHCLNNYVHCHDLIASAC
jgi:hypothetical protein